MLAEVTAEEAAVERYRVSPAGRPLVICLEGIDGCGKSTQADLLVRHYEERGVPVALVKHPGQTPFGGAVRKVLLSGSQSACDLAARLLFWADHLDAAASAGGFTGTGVVVLDRHPRYSNLAYGAAMGTDREILHRVDELLAPYGVIPDITLVLDVPAGVAWRRLMDRGKLTVVEERGLDYFRRVRQEYLLLTEVYLEVTVVDGTGEPQEVHSRVLGAIKARGFLAA
jgi:dTMP kinase